MGGRLGHAARLALALLVIACAMTAGYVQAASKPRPNLKVAKVAAGTGAVAPGAKFVVTDTTANSGAKRAGKSTTAYYLSTDARKDARDRKVGSRSVAPLKPRKSS